MKQFSKEELDAFASYLLTKVKPQSVQVYISALQNAKSTSHSTASKHYAKFLQWRTEKLKSELDRPQVVVEKVVEKIVHDKRDVKTISLVEEISTLNLSSDVKLECINAIIKRWRGEVSNET